MASASVSGRANCSAILALIASIVFAATATAQLPPTLPNPRLNWLFPAGGQVGKTFDVTASGDDLDEAKQLVFNHRGITAKLKTAPKGPAQSASPPVSSFHVSIAPDVPVGVYELRVLGKFGLSNPRAFAVGSLPEIRETEPNNLPKQANPVAVGTTINGTCEGPGLDYFKFSAKKGQRIIIDCWAFRIDSRLDATLVLYDSEGRELERNYNTNRRDPMIDFSVPADGEYLVSIHDHMYGYYALPAECYYRLTISTGPYLDFIFPPAGMPGSSQKYTVYGRNLPGGKLAPGMMFGGKQLEALSVTIPMPGQNARDLVREGGLYVEPSESFMDGISYRLKMPSGLSNPLLLTPAGAPILIEDEEDRASVKVPLLTPPCEYVGQFYPRGHRPRVSFHAKKGDVYWIEVFSQRLGLATDPRFVIQQVKCDEKGTERVIDLQTVDDDLANAERVHWSYLDSVLYDMTTHDPATRFVAPEDGTYRILLEDLARPSLDVLHAAKGDPRRVYRLSIRRPVSDFRLVAVPRPPTNLPAEIAAQTTIWSPALRPGGAELIEVFAYRKDGFDGEIRVTADNLPPGLTTDPIVIAPKQTSATLILKATDNAPAGMSPLNLKGTARLGESEAVRQARYATMIWAVQPTGVTNHRSRLTDQLYVSVAGSEPALFSLSVDPSLRLETSLAGSVKVPVKVVRRGSFKGAVELFVYGLPPTTSGPLHAQPKYHAPTTIPADKDTTEFTITVPNYVPPGKYTFFVSGVGTVQYARKGSKPADLKISSPSNRITMAISPAPVELQLSSAHLTVKQGARVETPLTIKRLYGFANPVSVQFLGVFNITGINAPIVTIPSGKSEGPLVIEALASAVPGTYASTVQAAVTFNGQPLTVKRDLTLTIAPAGPAKK
jgi:hypothetical protein